MCQLYVYSLQAPNWMEKLEIQRVKYQPCHAPQHEGEHLNWVCTETACNNLLICALCRFEKHQNHNVVFAKCLLNQAVNTIQQRDVARSKENIRKIVDTAQEKCEEAIKNIVNLQQMFKEVTDKIITDLKQYYRIYIEQVEKVANTQVNTKVLTEQSLASVLALLKFVTGDNLCKLVDSSYLLNKNTKQMEDTLLLWAQKYNQKDKLVWITHSNIEVEDNKIKSVGAVTYKVAYLESSLRNQKRKFRVKIIHDTNNWVGVGICHKTKVDSKEYQFNSHAIGHGCYMIISNGTVWSSIQSDINGCVKSFKFVKGDIIQVEYDPIAKKVRFKKQGSTNPKDSYEISFEPSQANDLRFALLFYYLNDEIEMLTTSLC